MKLLIIGLGNPGIEYLKTRHNVGFMVLDRMIGRESFVNSKYGEIAEFKFRSRNHILLKPNTFMNLSGKAVVWHLNSNKIKPSELLVITDDLALDFGTIRFREKGSAGGHNGLKSIIEALGTSDFPRLRIGIGSNYKHGKQVDFVLSDFTEPEQIELPAVLDQGIEVIKDFGFLDSSQLMSKYNKRVIES